MKHLLLLSILLVASCRSAESNPDLEEQTELAVAPALAFVDPWTIAFEPPTTLDGERLHLEPLGPDHAELDFEAFMSSREHLLASLHWGSWPGPDSTVAGNRNDLSRHTQEFIDREGYAYTVLTPDRSRCLGCVYMNPVPAGPDGYGVAMAYWVITSELDSGLDRELVASVLSWITADWPFGSLVMPIHIENQRGAEIARSLGLSESPEIEDDHRIFTWTR